MYIELLNRKREDELSRCCLYPQMTEESEGEKGKFRCSHCGVFTKPCGHAQYRSRVISRLKQYFADPYKFGEKAAFDVLDLLDRWREKVEQHEDEKLRAFYLNRIEGLRECSLRLYRAKQSSRFINVHTEDWHMTLRKHLKNLRDI